MGCACSDESEKKNHLTNMINERSENLECFNEEPVACDSIVFYKKNLNFKVIKEAGIRIVNRNCDCDANAAIHMIILVSGEKKYYTLEKNKSGIKVKHWKMRKTYESWFDQHGYTTDFEYHDLNILTTDIANYLIKYELEGTGNYDYNMLDNNCIHFVHRFHINLISENIPSNTQLSGWVRIHKKRFSEGNLCKILDICDQSTLKITDDYKPLTCDNKKENDGQVTISNSASFSKFVLQTEPHKF